MRSRLSILLLVVLPVLVLVAPRAQEPDARMVLQAALKAMGGENLKSITYSGSAGYIANVGQNYSPAMDWPANQIVSYTRTIDYDAKSSRTEYTLKQGTGQGGPAGGGNAPVLTGIIVGEQRTIQVVNGNVAWNVNPMNAVVPAPADAEQRQLEVWLTPHGCLKAGLMPGANPIAIERNEQGKGRIRAVSFMVMGKYRVQCGINDKNLVERVQTYFPNPVVGDLYYELVLTNYKDFNGVMFPGTFHAHHDLDDDLEGEGVNVSGGHNSFGLTVSNVQLNVADAVPAVPDAARTATVQPVRVESTKVVDGFWYVGGGSHSSMAVEFRDFVAVIEAPLNEDRSLAVIREVKKLIPNKPIRYLVSTHHHWDHLGGIRTYVAQENVTIIVQQANHSYYAEVLTVRPWLLKPDRLSLFPPEEVSEGYTFEQVGQKYVLTDGTKVMEVYNVQGLQHAQGMLIAYLPKEKIVVEADLFTPPAQGAPMPAITPSHRSFYNNVQRLKLDVQTIAPVHGGRTYPWADFVKFVQSAKTE